MATILASGCASPNREVVERIDKLRHESSQLVDEQSSRPLIEISWNEAVRQVQTNNLDMRTSELTLWTASNAVRQVYKDLRPDLNLTASVYKQLNSFSHWAADDVQFSAYSFVNFPGLIGFPRQLYAAKLSELRAQTAHLLLWRQKNIELYLLAKATQEWRERQAALRFQKRITAAVGAVDPAVATKLETESSKQTTQLFEQQQTLLQQTGQLLGDLSKGWLLTSNGLPTLEFSDFDLRDTNHVGQLQLRLTAIEIEGAVAQLKGIKLQYWPDLYVGIDTPSLVQKYGQSVTYFNADSASANASLYWRLDTKGQIASQLRRGRREFELQLIKIRQEARVQIQKLLSAQRVLPDLQAQIQRLDDLLQLTSELPPPRSFEMFQQSIGSVGAIVEQRRSLQRQVDQLQTAFWLVDDSKWPRLAGLADATPK